MAKWTPCKRRDFITKLKKLDFESPEPGGRHFYMRHGTFTLPLPTSVIDPMNAMNTINPSNPMNPSNPSNPITYLACDSDPGTVAERKKGF